MTGKLKKIKKFATNSSKGFTLIETLVAVLLLMMSIAGPLTLAERGLQATLVAKDQDTAFYLAQDAVEYVRWVRDTNRLRSQPWLAGLDNTANGHTNGGTSGTNNCTAANGCIVDSLKDTVATCLSVPCSLLNYDSNNNYFTYSPVGSGISATIFTRTVKIVTPIGGNAGEASITVTVTWSDQGTLVRTVTVREDIFDWQ